MVLHVVDTIITDIVNRLHSEKMATQSFHEMMEIDTPEKARNLVKAFEVAEARGPLESDSDIFERLEEGRKWLAENVQ